MIPRLNPEKIFLSVERHLYSAVYLAIFAVSVWSVDFTGAQREQWWCYLYTLVLVCLIFILIAKYPPSENPKITFFASQRKLSIRDWQWVTFSAGMMLILACLGSTYIFKRLPTVADTYAQFVQAKIFASGHLYSVLNAPPPFFDMKYVYNGGKFFSQYPPGHSLLLALGVLIGMPWIINPLLGALCTIAIYYLTLEIGNRYAARMASILLIFCPLIFFMAAEYMNHLTAIFCTLCFALFYIRAHRCGKPGDAFLAGSALGYLCITRPQVALPLALPFMVHWLFTTLKHRPRVFWIAGGAMAAGCGLFLCFFLYYNYEITGNALMTGYEKNATDSWHVSSLLIQDNLLSGIGRAKSQLRLLNKNLFSWPIPALSFVLFLFLLRLTKDYCVLLTASVIMVELSLVPIRFNGTVFLPRYLSEAGSYCIVLTAICLSRLPAWAKKNLHSKQSFSCLWRTVCLMIAALYIVYAPYKLTKYLVQYTNDYWEGEPNFYYRLQGLSKPALVFVSQNYKSHFPATLFFPPDDRSGIITANDLGSQNQYLINLYPHRFVYLAKGDNIKLFRAPLN